MNDKYLLQYIETFLEPTEINNLLKTNKYYYSLFKFLGYINLEFGLSKCYIYQNQTYNKINNLVFNPKKQIILNLSHSCYDLLQGTYQSCGIFDRLKLTNMLNEYSSVHINGCNKYMHTIASRDSLYEPLQIYKFDNLKNILEKNKTYYFLIDLTNFRLLPKNKIKLYMPQDKYKEITNFYKSFTKTVIVTKKTLIIMENEEYNYVLDYNKDCISKCSKAKFVIYNYKSKFFIKKLII